MSIYIFLIAFSLFLPADSKEKKEDYDWKCTDKVCQDVKCPPLPKECWDEKKGMLFPRLESCNCCDHCFLFQDEGEDCVKRLEDFQLPSHICRPGYTCNKHGKCEKMSREDPTSFPNYKCDGGICRCAVLTRDGNVEYIFGEFNEDEMDENEKQCECSVVAHKARKQEFRVVDDDGVFQPSPRCLDNGQFDPLQCIDRNCGCVERDTGIPDDNGLRYYVKTLAPNHPKCFDRRRHKKGKYYTECEERRNRIMQDINEGFWKGVDLIHFNVVNCYPNGSYAP